MVRVAYLSLAGGVVPYNRAFLWQKAPGAAHVREIRASRRRPSREHEVDDDQHLLTGITFTIYRIRCCSTTTSLVQFIYSYTLVLYCTGTVLMIFMSASLFSAGCPPPAGRDHPRAPLDYPTLPDR